MRLTELNPRWLTCTNPDLGGSEGRSGMGISFQMPDCEHRITAWFKNPLDGGTPINEPDRPRCLWQRTGDTFDTLTLEPSIDASPDWHGWVRNGEVTNA